MPGFCGIYRYSGTIDSNFSTQKGITKTNEKDISLEQCYIRQYIIPKFEQDKLFHDTDCIFYCTDGILLNANELYSAYNTQNKTDLFYNMYAAEGITAIMKLRGVFSGVVIDKKSKKLHLFTDHLGSKRLFYYYNKETKDFFFGSDLKVVTTIMQKYGYKTTLDEDGAYCLLTFGYMLLDKTLCQNVNHLEPGTILSISLDTGEISKDTYFTLTSTLYINDTEENIIAELDKRFNQAIKREYDVDKEYGYRHIVTLSGGLDSRMTLVKGVMQGYKNIQTLTFSETGYLDQLISQKIAADLNCDYVFHALDNGNYLLDIKQPVIANDGLILYSGAAHQLSSVAMLNWDELGLLHTGMIGDLVLGSYLLDKKHHLITKDMIHKISYSSKLLHKVPSNMLETMINQHDTDEMCAFYERCINGVYNGYFMTQNYSEYASPFLDVDFVEYVMKINPELRYGNKLYAKWITKTTPIAEKYIWEATGTKINTPHFIGFCKRAIRYAKGMIGNQRLVSMNPFKYWYAHNPAIKEYFDAIYTTKINLLHNHNTLTNDVIDFYTACSPLEKTQILTLLEAVEWLQVE